MQHVTKSTVWWKKGFDSDPVYDDKYINTKVKFFGGKIKTNFLDNDVPNELARCMLHW